MKDLKNVEHPSDLLYLLEIATLIRFAFFKNSSAELPGYKKFRLGGIRRNFFIFPIRAAKPPDFKKLTNIGEVLQ
jgi:hypothetical protein